MFVRLQIRSVQMPRQSSKVKDNLSNMGAQMEPAWLNVTKTGSRGHNRRGEEASPSFLPAAPGLPPNQRLPARPGSGEWVRAASLGSHREGRSWGREPVSDLGLRSL